MFLNFRATNRAVARVALAGALAVSTGAAVADSAALQLVGAGTEQVVDLTLEDLAEMPQVTIVTENEFTDGVVTYRGPLVREVLALVDLEKLEEVRFVAANDYFVEIPTSDFQQYDAILAIEADGKPLSRREKGPIWLMYPISEFSELRNPEYLRRLIWQVVRIEAP